MSTLVERAERNRLESLFREWLAEVKADLLEREIPKYGEEKAKKHAAILEDMMLQRLEEPLGLTTWYSSPDTRKWERDRNT